MKRRHILVFIGPQGSGKGTQATILADKHGFVVLSFGELLRAEVARGTALGKKLAEIMEAGQLVSDKMSGELVREELKRLPSQSNIVFDGFPRTVEQARFLDTLVDVTRAVHIEIPYEVSVKRISGRLICENGHNYNRYYLPPQKPGICNVDKKPLSSRPDDTEASVINRLAIYQQITTRVLTYYRDQNKLVTVNGNASVFAVAHEIQTKVLGDML